MSSTETLLLAALRLGAVHPTVAELDRAVAWYQRGLGTGYDTAVKVLA